VSGNGQDALEPTLRRVEDLIAALDGSCDAASREPARRLIELVLDLHGLALARLMSAVSTAAGGDAIVERLIEDEHVRAVLLLHGLHPDNFATRLHSAVERLRPHLGVQGVTLRVSQVDGRKVRLRLDVDDGVKGRFALLWSLRREVEDAILDAAPDLESLMVEGLDEPQMPKGEPECRQATQI
jgi:hypothetical protein